MRDCRYVDGALCSSHKGYCHHSQHTLDTLGCQFLSWPEHNSNIKEIHISDIRTFKDCRVKWNFTSPLRHHLEPKIPRTALWLGSGVHYALGEYYGKGRSFHDLMDAWNEWVDCEQERLAGLNQDIDQDKLEESMSLGDNMLRHYYVWAQEHDNFEVIASEVRIKVPLPELGDDVFFVGTTDGLVKMDGEYWLLEHKTAARLPEYRVLALDDQGPAYVWGVSQDSKFEGIRPKGVLFNFLVKKHTQEPKHLQNGGLSKAKSVKVSPELYRYYLRKYDLNPEPYTGILEYLEYNPKYFRRDPLIVTDERLDIIERNLRHVASDMVSDPTVYPSQNWSWFKCKICPFSTVCTLRLNGADVRPLLRSNFRKRPEYHLDIMEDEEDD